MFDIPEKREFKYVLDLADVPVQLGKEGFDRFVMERMSREAEKADGVTAVSEGLTQYVWEKYGRKTIAGLYHRAGLHRLICIHSIRRCENKIGRRAMV